MMNERFVKIPAKTLECAAKRLQMESDEAQTLAKGAESIESDSDRLQRALMIVESLARGMQVVAEMISDGIVNDGDD